jgi:hypothetical protein
MSKALRLPREPEQAVLDQMSIHLVSAATEQKRWNQLVAKHHYLRTATLVGEQLRYVLTYQGQWLALLGWSTAALHLKARDQWLGLTAEQLPLRRFFLANNARFCILADRQQFPNLGTKAMRLCLERLSQDWLAAYGHPILVVESFVDSQLFRGTIYKASNWTDLGGTAGFARNAEDFYVLHDRPKQLWVRALHPEAREWLSAPALPEPLQKYEKLAKARCQFRPDELDSLRARFAQVREFRKGQGRRHRIPTVLAIAACAKISGVPGGYSGIAAYAQNLTRPQRRALCCWFNPKTKEYEVPSESCILRVLQGVNPLEVEKVTLEWQDLVLGPNTDPLVAIDGKTVRHSGVHLAGAISLPSHRCLGVEPVADKSNEIPAVQRLIERAPILPGQLVSFDAMNSQHKTVGQILYDKGADYLLTLKGNQEGLLKTAKELLPESVPPSGGPGGGQSQPPRAPRPGQQGD